MSKQETRKMYRTARKEDFPVSLKLVMDGRTIEYSKVRWTIDGQDRGLRYGTNPHQKAALYKPVDSLDGIGKVEWIKWGKEGPSATNIEDGSHGLRIVDHFTEPAVTVMKHLNPSGVALAKPGEALSNVYIRALGADTRAAFGGVVVFNTTVDKPTAEEIVKTFVEVVYAPSYHPQALPVFETKKDIRIGKVTRSLQEALPPDIVVLNDGSI